MSTIITNNIVLPDASSEISVNALTSNALVAWVCFYHNSASVTVRGSLNVSSVTYVGSGKHYLTLPFALDATKVGFLTGYTIYDQDAESSSGQPLYYTDVGVKAHSIATDTSRVNVSTWYTAQNGFIGNGLVFVGITHNKTGG